MICIRAVLFCALSLVAVAIAGAAERPNVILIISDDHGFSDYGFIGHKTVQTPSPDRLASQSVLDTRGMTDTAGRHGDAGLAIGRKGMKPVLDFIATAQAAKKPFFVWYAPMMPHLPHNPPQELLAKYQGKGLPLAAEKYYAKVEWFDQTCGELDNYLIKNKLADNTVILYLADNGWDGVNAQVVLDGWSKLLIPGPPVPDRNFASAPKTIELFDLKSDPLETNNVAASRPDEVKRLQAIQHAAWDFAKGPQKKQQP